MAYPFGPEQKPETPPYAVLQYKRQDTSIAQAVHNTENQSQYDAACKRLLSEKIILAWILKECVPEYKDEKIDDIMHKYIEGVEVSVVPVQGPRIHGDNTEDTDLHEGTIRYDIFFRALLPKGQGRMLLLINVEAQNKENEKYPLVSRMMYHLARLASSQHGVEFIHDDYGNLQKVYSIWICMDAPKSRANSMNVYEMTEKQVAGNVKLKKSDYDLMTGILLWLGDPGSEKYDGIYKLLHTLLSNKVKEPKKRQVLEEEFHIPMSEKMEKEVSEMCNLSQGILEQGMEKQRLIDERKIERIQKKMERQNIQKMKQLLAAGVDKTTIASVFDCSLEELEGLSKKKSR
ncbi:hypothetical protein [uncultured Dubosiella sp.]|uniref:hypothetical protein n=1 Tax=uncultured Dubosiella sp. TaxID=1937011 RepID=UPI00259425C1|nr:hypothetical protein [uncultured Dubosiella sp.]